ncbi:MAG TPA: 30S ribosomal protein S13 [bacterium]|nr:30S ribosomal protein S13 [bacterium]HNS34236.1 30S ribosomal protein S13 [bacterium]HNW08996.1 30S ribosomal protein S13 [bacterium]HNZ73530.1 30S ribosomal protein S13 [bacterium]HOH67386.1 30S ribosomal protein S13 [bacterium]
MAVRIAGTILPNDKRVEIGLTYILGIGRKLSSEVLAKTGIDPNIRVKDLSEDQANSLRTIVEKNYRVEGDLRREVAGNIKRLKEIKCHRGLRHAKNLPVRGQRTKTNNRTVRGNVRRTMGSGRKDAAQKT